MTNITIAEFDNDVMADLDNDTFISIVETPLLNPSKVHYYDIFIIQTQ